MTYHPQIADLIHKAAYPLRPSSQDFAPLLRQLTQKHFILLGEATHGTHEFYQTRIAITKQLILHHGLNAIAIEGDWPSVYRTNRYVRWQGDDKNPNDALSDFKRFPLWMWRNTPMLDFILWLRQHNEGLPSSRQVGFYGLDMYSLYESIAAVLEYLDNVDPEAAHAARKYYACLGRAGYEGYYGYHIQSGKRRSCETEVIQQLLMLRENSLRYIRPGDEVSEDDQFQAEQNARLIHSAENYYRQMFDSRVNTWNLRDSHMMETLDNLQQHLTRRLQQPASIAIWEHNSHVGDARATYMGPRNQHNLGQLVRERHGAQCALIGFTTHKGTVTAASTWDGPAERKNIRPSLPDSVEYLFHSLEFPDFLLPLHGEVAQALQARRLQRAIGVLYLPETERASHYFHCHLSDQFDAVLHLDTTTAIEPLDPTSEWLAGEQSTFPFGV